MKASKPRSGKTPCRKIIGLAPNPTAYLVLGRRAVTAFAMVFAITPGGDERRSVDSETSDSATAFAYAS
jgi:hypothetical protein